jgi:hypothetical protein
MGIPRNPTIQQQQQMVPGLPQFQPEGSGYDMLKNMYGIFFKKKISDMEIITGFEVANKFYYYPFSNEEELVKLRDETKLPKDKVQFMSLDISPPRHRAMLAKVRPFNVDLNFFRNGAIAPFITLDRPYILTCCCSGRPVSNVYDLEGGKKPEDKVSIGKIEWPWTFCNPQINVYNKENQVFISFFINLFKLTLFYTLFS